ncbi:MAG: DNA polymerase III subunit delta' [Candidatus Auribacterota bacterium]|nr:DNA polymerase III subunit delta' [Candidatus Auribacterota bacterium]
MYFEGIVSHERQCGILYEAIDNSRLAHTYLFCGPDGVGKKLVAVWLAKVLNCMAENNRPCNTCGICRRIEKGIYPDVKILKPRGKDRIINVESVGEIQRFANQKAYESKIKVIIIDDAHRMREAASNKLLKTLEEPPAKTVLILITSRLDMLFATVISRCQTISFNLVPEAEIERYLVDAKGIEASEARVIASLSGGRISEAVKLLSDDLAEKRSEYINFMKSLLKGDAAAMFDIVKRLKEQFEEMEKNSVKMIMKSKNLDYREFSGNTGDELEDEFKAEAMSMVQAEKEEMFGIWQLWFRDILITKECGAEVNIINKEDAGEIRLLSEKAEYFSIMGCIRAIDDARKMLRYHADLSMVMEDLFITIMKNFKNQEAVI